MVRTLKHIMVFCFSLYYSKGLKYYGLTCEFFSWALHKKCDPFFIECASL